MSDKPTAVTGIDPSTVQPLDVPTSAVSQFGLNATSNEVMLVGNELVPGVTADGLQTPVARIRPIVMLRFSPQTLKDLSILLSDTVKQFEANYGLITTDFTRSRQSGK